MLFPKNIKEKNTLNVEILVGFASFWTQQLFRFSVDAMLWSFNTEKFGILSWGIPGFFGLKTSLPWPRLFWTHWQQELSVYISLHLEGRANPSKVSWHSSNFSIDLVVNGLPNQVTKNIEHYNYLFDCTGLKTLVVAVGSRWVALTLNARQSRKSEPVCPVGHVQKGVQTSTAGGKSNLWFPLG